jgi:5-methylcytosine-specific restriction endonuclease McrA
MLLTRLENACEKFGISLEDAISEKAAELELRFFLKCIPNERIRDHEIIDFLKLVIGGEPDSNLVEQVTLVKRDLSITKEERLEIERRQYSRCSICGCLLESVVSPHADHVIPIAYGGKNEISNIQLLCKKCNLGKSCLVGWQQASPFFIDQDKLTSQLRFAVLSRQKSCQSCGVTAGSSNLEVMQIISSAKGGRFIYDNLFVLCSLCAKESQRRQEYSSRIALKTSFHSGAAPRKLSIKRS